MFLLANYAAFESNNDQLRYHLYIPYVLAFVLPLACVEIFRRFAAGSRTRVPGLRCGLTLRVRNAILAGSHSVQLGVRWHTGLRTESWWDKVRRGGISICKRNLTPSGSFFAIPDTELAFYADRKSEFDYRLYFLSEDDLKSVFQDMGVSYIVIPDSATLPDATWNHVGKAPISFVEKVSQLYSKVFTTKAGDILVYRVR